MNILTVWLCDKVVPWRLCVRSSRGHYIIELGFAWVCMLMQFEGDFIIHLFERKKIVFVYLPPLRSPSKPEFLCLWSLRPLSLRWFSSCDDICAYVTTIEKTRRRWGKVRRHKKKKGGVEEEEDSRRRRILEEKKKKERERERDDLRASKI